MSRRATTKLYDRTSDKIPLDEVGTDRDLIVPIQMRGPVPVREARGTLKRPKCHSVVLRRNESWAY
jgi:hypothetical protein